MTTGKRRSGFWSILAVSAVATLVSVQAASQLRKNAPEPSPESTLASDTPTTEVVLLRTQLAVMKEYDQRLIATVYWSLGGVFLLVILVAGLNWFANYRLYERERDSLRESIRVEVQRVTSEATAKFEELRARVDQDIQQQVSSLGATLRSESASAVDSAKRAFKGQITRLEEEIQAIVWHDTEFRALYYEAQGDLHRATDQWIEHLRATRERSGFWDALWVGRAAKHLHSVLQKRQSIFYSQKDGLLPLLDEVPTSAKPEVDNLRRLLDSIPTH